MPGCAEQAIAILTLSAVICQMHVHGVLRYGCDISLLYSPNHD